MDCRTAHPGMSGTVQISLNKFCVDPLRDVQYADERVLLFVFLLLMMKNKGSHHTLGSHCARKTEHGTDLILSTSLS